MFLTVAAKELSDGDGGVGEFGAGDIVEAVSCGGVEGVVFKECVVEVAGDGDAVVCQDAEVELEVVADEGLGRVLEDGKESGEGLVWGGGLVWFV